MSVNRTLPVASEPQSGSQPEYGGCVWPADFGAHLAEWEAFEYHQRQTALQLASTTLQRLVGYRVSNCPLKLRPCLSRPSGQPVAPYNPALVGAFYPVMTDGVWANVCSCSGACSCATACEVDLPGPVGRIDEVRCDGSVVDPEDYAVQDGHILVWRGAGPCPWVLNQNMALPDTEPGTMSVTYLNAYPVDANGAYAVGILARQYARAYSGKGDCWLPKNVTNLVRNGVAMEIISGAFPNGLTGMREVDAYIGAWNPGRLRQAPMIYSPDAPKHRVDGGPITAAPYELIDGGSPGSFDGGAP